MVTFTPLLKVLQRQVYSACSTGGAIRIVIISLASALLLALGFILSAGVSIHDDITLRGSQCPTALDNIGGVDASGRLCHQPIDVVYTWVNGSDMQWFKTMLRYRKQWDADHGLLPIPASSADAESEARCAALASDLNSTWPAGNSSNITALLALWNCTNATSSVSSGGMSLAPDDVASLNRYRDNDELRFSIRSLYKYAPWVRNVILVTNGQVPWWLDVEHPRVRVVTHEEIYANASHLPVFSSPSIEVHLHKIPGLSTRFVYFNDDVFLGADTWPDDFFTHAQGQRVYLAWEVPKCNAGCVDAWIGDGYCDAACNVSRCMWDAGDCVNSTKTRASTVNYNHKSKYDQYHHKTGSSSDSSTTSSNSNSNTAAVASAPAPSPVPCAPGCRDEWIGDRTCDDVCRTPACGWDAGDCGVETVTEAPVTSAGLGLDTGGWLRARLSAALHQLQQWQDITMQAAVASISTVSNTTASNATNSSGLELSDGEPASGSARAPVTWQQLLQWTDVAEGLHQAEASAKAMLSLPAQPVLHATSLACAGHFNVSSPSACGGAAEPACGSGAGVDTDDAQLLPIGRADALIVLNVSAVTGPAVARLRSILTGPVHDVFHTCLVLGWQAAQAAAVGGQQSTEEQEPASGNVSPAASTTTTAQGLSSVDASSLIQSCFEEALEEVGRDVGHGVGDEGTHDGHGGDQQTSDGGYTLVRAEVGSSSLVRTGTLIPSHGLVNLVLQTQAVQAYASEYEGKQKEEEEQARATASAAGAGDCDNATAANDTATAGGCAVPAERDASHRTQPERRALLPLPTLTVWLTLKRQVQPALMDEQHGRNATAADNATASDADAAATTSSPAGAGASLKTRPNPMAGLPEELEVVIRLNLGLCAALPEEQGSAGSGAAGAVEGNTTVGLGNSTIPGNQTTDTVDQSQGSPSSTPSPSAATPLPTATATRARPRVVLKIDDINTPSRSLAAPSTTDDDARAPRRLEADNGSGHAAALDGAADVSNRWTGAGDAEGGSAASSMKDQAPAARRLTVTGQAHEADQRAEVMTAAGRARQDAYRALRMLSLPVRSLTPGSYHDIDENVQATQARDEAGAARRLGHAEGVSEAAAPIVHHVAGTEAYVPDDMRASLFQRLLAQAWSNALQDAGLAGSQPWPRELEYQSPATSQSSSSNMDGSRRPSARRLADTYAESLVTSNRLINRLFKARTRKVPAHMPHMIEVAAMEKLQAAYPVEFEATSARRFRDGDDIQYAFTYMWFLLEGGARAGLDVASYFGGELDTDQDGVLSANELRTLAAVVHKRSPTDAEVSSLRDCLAPVTRNTTTRAMDTPDGTVHEETVTVTVPHITWERLIACPAVMEGLSKHARFGPTGVEVPNSEEVAFEMVSDDFNKTRGQLDSVRARRPKFVCVNDDMKEAPGPVKQLLRDFYVSFFPVSSPMELPPGHMNPVLHIGPLNALHARTKLERHMKIGAAVAVVLVIAWLACCRRRSATLVGSAANGAKGRPGSSAATGSAAPGPDGGWTWWRGLIGATPPRTSKGRADSAGSGDEAEDGNGGQDGLQARARGQGQVQAGSTSKASRRHGGASQGWKAPEVGAGTEDDGGATEGAGAMPSIVPHDRTRDDEAQPEGGTPRRGGAQGAKKGAQSGGRGR